MRREHLNFASLTCYILFQFDYVHVLFGTQLLLDRAGFKYFIARYAPTITAS
jgi:hypothetical protein